MNKTIIRRVLALLLVLTVLGGATALRVQAFSTEWVGASQAALVSADGDAVNEDSVRTNLCEGSGVGFATWQDPPWVPISGIPNPTDTHRTFVQASGQVFYGPFTAPGRGRGNPYVTHTDNPYAHWHNDINVMLTPDKDSAHILADGNFHDNGDNANELANIEIEWENSAAPKFAWPSSGDRMTVWGNQIWDCAHGGPDKYRTEIHPPAGWVVYRQSASELETPSVVPLTGVNKKDESPWQWYESTDLQGMAATLPTTALKNTPVQATVADAVFSSYGGQVMEVLDGCSDNGNIGAAQVSYCFGSARVNDLPNTDFGRDHPELVTKDLDWLDNIVQQDYTFFVPAPPLPDDATGDVDMVFEVEDHCADFQSDPGEVRFSDLRPGDPQGFDFENIGPAGSGEAAYHIGDISCGDNKQGALQDTIVQTVDPQSHKPGLLVTVHGTLATYPSNHYTGYAKRFKVAWDYVPVAAKRAKTFKVDFEKLIVRNDGDAVCEPPGEWAMHLRVNEKWIYPVHGSGEGGKPFWLDSAVDDGLGCFGFHGPPKKYDIGESLQVSVLPDQKVHIGEWSFEVDFVSGLPDMNDVMPAIDFSQTAPITHEVEGDTLFEASDGSHDIQISMTDITPPLPQGQFQIAGPTYGPNADTQGAIRISGQSHLNYTLGANAVGLQYRTWAPGQQPPPFWQTLNGSGTLEIPLGNIGAGTLKVEYAPISGDGIVGERQRQIVELDATPPTLIVPATMKVPASQATGAFVTFATQSGDELPGPVAQGCDHKSGDFFLIKHNTVVTCTATDAVGNTTTKSFTISVYSPFGYIPDFVALGHDSTELGQNVIVETGNVGAFDASAGVNKSGYEVAIGKNSVLHPNSQQPIGTSQIAANRVLFGYGAGASEVYVVGGLTVADPNTAVNKRPGYVPLFPRMPDYPKELRAGREDVYVVEYRILEPGAYHDVLVPSNSVLVLSGNGQYTFNSLRLEEGAQLYYGNGTTVNILKRLSTASGATISPDAEGPQPQGSNHTQAIFYVLGGDPTTGQPIVEIGDSNQLAANVYAPNGTLAIGNKGLSVGAFLGKNVKIGDDAILAVKSRFEITYP